MRGNFASANGPGSTNALRLLLALVAALCLASSVRAQMMFSPLLKPSAIAYDTAGNLFITDANRQQVLEATVAGTLIVVAGTGTQGFAGDGGQALAAELNSPQGLAFGPDGTLYIADTGNARIRALTAGVITTVAGTGMAASGPDGGPASATSLRQPTALAVDASGNLLVCDTADHRIRRITAGVITTVAGTGLQGYAGDGGPASKAQLDSPTGIATSPDGRIVIADTHNARIRVVATDGTISTVAGTGQRGFSGDGGPAIAARLSSPRGLALASNGALLIADADNDRLRSVDSQGIITSLAGSGIQGISTDGTAAAQAALHAPRALAVFNGMPVLVDALNSTVRVLTPAGTLFRPAALAPGRTSSVQLSAAPTQTYGQTTASVTVTGTVGVPAGTVSITENGTAVGTATLAAGAVSMPLTSLAAGPHTLAITYSGDGLNPAAASSPSLQITPAQAIVTAQPASVPYGAPIPALTGTLSGILPTDTASVTAIFSTAANPTTDPGTYPIAATLTGPKSANYTLSLAQTSGTLTITQANSTVTLGTLAQSYASLPLRLTATVASTTSGQPSGTVQFLDGSTLIATATLTNGSASAVYTAPPAGTLILSAHYSGSLDFASSTSATETGTVSAIPDFLLTTTGASTATIPAGSLATFNVTVQAAPAPFTGAVTFSATGLPPGASATFSPVQVVPGAGSATVTVTIQTAAPIASLIAHSDPTWALAGLALGTGLLRKRRRASLLILSALLCLSGCGARTVDEAGGGLTTRTYPFQITGTSTNLLGSTVTHTTTLTLIVQQ